MSVNDRLVTQQKRFVKLTPTNNSSNTWSYTNGNNIIRFSIAEQDAYLLASQVELQFKFKVFRNVAKTTNILHADNLNIDEKIGAESVIQTLTISSRRYATSICEQIRNWNQLVAIAKPSLSSKRDVLTQHNHSNGATGLGIYNRDEEDLAQNRLADVRTGNKILTRKLFQCDGAVAQNVGHDCSVNLYSGIFTSMPQLDLRLMGGLELEIELASDLNVFFNEGLNNPLAGDSINYELSDVILNCPLLYKNNSDLASGVQPNQLSFLTWNSLYNVAQSTDTTISNKVGMRSVLSMVQKFVPVSHINNLGQRAFVGLNPGVKRLTYHRNGQRYPLEYEIKTERGELGPGLEAVHEKNPMVLINSLSAFQNYKDVKHTHITSQNLDDRANAPYFLGVSFDQISGQGIDLTGGTISTELVSTLMDPNTPDGTAVAPFGVFTFFLNKNTLVIQPNARIQAIE
mgnify:CR=1 FL=1|tara:strand:+ start:308 stop:1681 length:1374 start_codon:yes stop_codon:yes gene_type:complete